MDAESLRKEYDELSTRMKENFSDLQEQIVDVESPFNLLKSSFLTPFVQVVSDVRRLQQMFVSEPESGFLKSEKCLEVMQFYSIYVVFKADLFDIIVNQNTPDDSDCYLVVTPTVLTVFAEEIAVDLSKLSQSILSGMSVFYNMLDNMLKEGRRHFENITNGIKTHVWERIELELVAYSREHYDVITKRTVRQAENFKTSRANSLSPVEWGKMIGQERSALKLAASGKLKDAEESFSWLGTASRYMMDMNPSLMKQMLDIGSDERLFDLELLEEYLKNFPRLLHGGNMGLFCRLFLRHNIIRCQLHPELKEEFEGWMAPRNQYPEIEDEHTILFGATSPARVSKVLHALHDFTQEWQQRGASRKWMIVYRLLKDLQYFVVEEREVYAQFVRSVICYCKPDTKENYSDTLKKVTLPVPRDYWPAPDRKLYNQLRDVLPPRNSPNARNIP